MLADRDENIGTECQSQSASESLASYEVSEMLEWREKLMDWGEVTSKGS